MILTGSKISSVKHARLFARHLFKEENIEIMVHESPLGSNSRAEIEDDLVDFQLQTDLTQGSFGIFHVAVSPNPNDAMNSEQWNRSVELIEEEFGLSGLDLKPLGLHHLFMLRQIGHAFYVPRSAP